MPRTKSSRKRQSRLEFTPLPSSSPSAKSYHKQIQDRAAAVTIQGSPASKKRPSQHLSDDEDALLPTPAATTNEEPIEVSDDEPVRSTQRRRHGSSPEQQQRRPSPRKSRSKQQRLELSNARDADTFDSPIRLASASRLMPSGKGVFSSAGPPKMVELSSDSDSDSDLPSARKIVARSKQEQQSRGGKKKEKEKRVTRSSQRPVLLSDSEQEGIVVARARMNRVISDDEDSGEDMPTTQPTLRHKRKRRSSVDSFISDSPPPAPDSDDDVIEVRKPARKRKRRASEGGTSEEDSHVQGSVRTPGRRLTKRSRQLSQREKDDLAEDLAELGSSDAPSSPQPPRSTQSAEKNARQKALERLKRKRGTPLDHVEEADEEDEEQADEDLDDDHELNEDSEEAEVAAPMSSRQMFQPDEEDEDFLVDEDDDDPLGIPEGVPLEFTRYASMKGRELFKFAILWMVQKKINPAFDMNADIYNLTFRKLDDEVRGLAGSKFTSSAWTPEFTIALQARPDIAYSRSPIALRDKCDACNRSQHPATYEAQFQKKPYDPRTLDDVDNDDDDDEDDSEQSSNEDAGDKPDYDAQGRKILPENTMFYVGKFCMANAITAHALNHWKYQLYGVVVAWLKKAGYLKPDKIVQRDKLSTRKRGKQAHKTLARIENEGQLKSLWKTFRDSIDAARDSKQGRYAVESP
ncbi:hypothetical protein Slin14017_G027250 [Septoria linicola]|nr:hypothetical protein Slin14017_G027250 [Septoria linicola]